MRNPIILSGDEIIKPMDNIGAKFIGGTLRQFRDIDNIIKRYIQNFPNYRVWIGQGIRAEVLQSGKDWQKGTLKLVISYRVEFVPDESVPASQSPLDDLRSQLDK